MRVLGCLLLIHDSANSALFLNHVLVPFVQIIAGTARLGKLHGSLALMLLGLCIGGVWQGVNDLVIPLQAGPSAAPLRPGVRIWGRW